MAAAGTAMGAAQSITGFPGMMTMQDYNAEMEREMRQITDAGRKVFGALKGIFKKR
jgi:hypothetical protein